MVAIGKYYNNKTAQTNLYLNFFKNELCQPDNNSPIGIVLGAKRMSC